MATPIGNLQDISPRAIATLQNVDLIAAEDTRHSGKLLQEYSISTPMLSYHQHNRASRHEELIQRLATQSIAIISDAGTPAIADPGAELVLAAAEAGFRVVPIPGPSSMIAAVSASGLLDAPFYYLGFLPRVARERRLLLGKAARAESALVLFESPLRLRDTLLELAELLGDRSATVARELTKLHEEIIRGSFASLADRYGDQPPKGEIVVVVGPPTGDDLGRDSAEDVIRRLLRDKLRPAKAAREASAILGITGAEAYDLVRKIAAEDA
ncbi:MAG: 16S rRNA (cytidine(1402)-2'-O)-methyltransferase [Thermomicrobiales bacterium]